MAEMMPLDAKTMDEHNRLALTLIDVVDTVPAKFYKLAACRYGTFCLG